MVVVGSLPASHRVPRPDYDRALSRFSSKRDNPSSGIASHGAAYATKYRALGRIPGSRSNAPIRMPIGSAKPGLLLKRDDPHSRQNHFSRPSSGFQARSRSSPATICTVPAAARALIDAAIPCSRATLTTLAMAVVRHDERPPHFEADDPAVAATGERKLVHPRCRVKDRLGATTRLPAFRSIGFKRTLLAQRPRACAQGVTAVVELDATRPPKRSTRRTRRAAGGQGRDSSRLRGRGEARARPPTSADIAPVS